MKDIDKLIDNATSALDALREIGDEASEMRSAFERITDIARSLDESNWKESSEKIFQIAYEHY